MEEYGWTRDCQTKKDKYITSMWNLKNNELIYKTETGSPSQKTNVCLPKGKGRERDKLGLGLAGINDV